MTSLKAAPASRDQERVVAEFRARSGKVGGYPDVTVEVGNETFEAAAVITSATGFLSRRLRSAGVSFYLPAASTAANQSYSCDPGA